SPIVCRHYSDTAVLDSLSLHDALPILSPDAPDRCYTVAQTGDEAWLVRFTSRNLPLGHEEGLCEAAYLHLAGKLGPQPQWRLFEDRKSTRLNSSHVKISYAVFCLKKKK